MSKSHNLAANFAKISPQMGLQSELMSVAARHNNGFFFRPLTAPALSAFQDHPVSEAAEDQGASAESDRGLWPADGHVLHGKRGTS